MACEIEYRLTILMKVNTEIPFPKDAITEIIFGSRVDEENKNEIKEFVTKNFLM
ncbi:MAG: hypothetical protein ACXVNM_06225 [Bacteroidia bacterium]